MVESVDNVQFISFHISYVEIQKNLLENYDGQSFTVIQVFNITCSPSLKYIDVTGKKVYLTLTV